MMKIACMDDNFMRFILSGAMAGSGERSELFRSRGGGRIDTNSCQFNKKDYNLGMMKAAHFTLTVQVINMMKNEGTFWNRACG